jgi:RNA recognition motif-containing protein
LGMRRIALGHVADMDRHSTYDIFVSNVDPAVLREELSAMFERHGQIHSVSFLPSKEGLPTRACFVRFSSESEADDATTALNGTLLNGRQLKVHTVSRLWFSYLQY